MKVSLVLTILIVIVTSVVIFLYYLNIIKTDELSAMGSIFAAAGSIIAVIWFYNSLRQQNIQLKEQREQFQLEFNNSRLEWKRNTITLAKTLLDDMENKINLELEENGKIENLPLINRYIPTAILLAEFMVKIELDVVAVAGITSAALFQPEYVDNKGILELVLKCEQENKTLPQIAKIWRNTLSEISMVVSH